MSDALRDVLSAVGFAVLCWLAVWAEARRARREDARARRHRADDAEAPR